MYRILVSVLLLLATPALAQRPMSEMQGDCSNYATKLDREFELWGKPPELITAAIEVKGVPSAVSVDRKHVINLARHDDVKFAATPEQDRGAPDRFSGIVRLTVVASGTHRISASNGLWIDAVDGYTVRKSSTFEMQTKCPTIFKTVTYQLESGRPYWLQLNGSRTQDVGLLVTRVP